MKLVAAAPGKICESLTGGTTGTLFLIVSVHPAGQRQQALEGFAGRTAPDHATLAQLVNNDWRTLGEIVEVPIAEFSGQAPSFTLVSRRGPPITFMPGSSESAVDRLSRSKASLKNAGGARRTFNLTAHALEALQTIRVDRQRGASEKLDDTKVVNTLLIEEHARLRRRAK